MLPCWWRQLARVFCGNQNNTSKDWAAKLKLFRLGTVQISSCYIGSRESLGTYAFSCKAVLSPDQMIHVQIHMYDDTIAESLFGGDCFADLGIIRKEQSI